MCSWNCNKNCNGETCSKLAWRDLVCVAIVLISVIVCLITLNVGCDKETSDRYSFASTLVSIVLSVIAIIMSLLSGYKNDRAQDGLDSTLKTIKEVGTNIDTNSTKQIEQMRSLEKKISAKLDNLEKKLNKILNWDKTIIPSRSILKEQSWTDIGGKNDK